MSTGQAWAADQDDIFYNEYLPLCQELNEVSFHRFRTEWHRHFEELKNKAKRKSYNSLALISDNDLLETFELKVSYSDVEYEELKSEILRRMEYYHMYKGLEK